MADASLPLSRFTVLDLTRARSGPSAVRQLADFGANVIKIEDPNEKDGGSGPWERRHGYDFQNLQRNRRSVTLNLKTSRGRAILESLLGLGLRRHLGLGRRRGLGWLLDLR